MSHAYALDALPDLPIAEARALVGGKAANLAVMARDLGLPVPPGFVITTATCRSSSPTGWPAGLDDELACADGRGRGAVGRRFGDPSDPLLVSVRSGAPGLDARDDGHDPEPRPERRDDRRPGARRPATTRSPAAVASASRPSFRVDRRRRRRARGPVAAAAPGDRGRLPLVEQRPGRRLSAEGGHPGRPRDRR